MGFVFPGKFRQDSSGRTIDVHPLHQHSVDSAMCLKALLADPVSRAALARLAGLETLTQTQVDRLAALQFWHDVGKAATGFAARSIDAPGKPAESGHVEEAFALFDGKLAATFEHAFGLAHVAAWFDGSEDAACDFLLAALSHHGRPVKLPAGSAEMAELARAWEPWGEIDPADELMRMGLAVRAAFPDAFESEDPADRLPANPRFQAAFAGYSMLADWMASNADMFEFGRPLDERARWAEARARDLTRRAGWGLDSLEPMVGHPLDFEAVFGFAPNAMQSAVAELPLPASGSIVDIESDTGSGKTEAGLLRALKLVSAGLSSGVYFALPSRTSAVQIHRRVARAVHNLLGDAAPPVLLAVPGYLRVGEAEGRRPPQFRVLWSDGQKGPERWASENPKRFMAAPIVIGTIDQALMSVVRTGHAHMRAAMLARMAIVIDEVHASDARLHTFAAELTRRHLAHAGHVVLMSATFASTSRRRYLAEKPTTLQEACRLPYPAISMLAGDGAMTHVDPARLKPLVKSRRRRIRIEQLPELRDPKKIALVAAQAARKGAKVLVVRNTVGSAIEVQKALEELLEPELLFRVRGKTTSPHHSRFAAADRKLLDDAVEAAYGKGSKRQGQVLVATQTVEQSIDIDCDLIIMDICPMEVLIQRLGRLHRHDRKDRPAGFKQPRAIVVVPETRHLGLFVDRPHHGLGQAYADLRVIEATWRELDQRSHVVIPTENRKLVERTTHPEALETIAQEIGLVHHGDDIAANDCLANSEARASLLDIDHSFGDHAMDRSLASEDVRVRLGILDNVVTIEEEPMGPFGNRIGKLMIPGWMARPDHEDPAEKPELLTEEADCFEFAWGWREERHRIYKPVFRYSRHGLEIVGKWRSAS